MKVYQVKVKLYMMRDIAFNHIQTKVTSLIDKGFAADRELLLMHEENCFKSYSYDLPYPLERDKIYKRGKIYTVTIRTIDPKLARYFYEKLANEYTEDLKGLTSEIRIIPRKPIASIYSLTPAILKDEKGYWKGHMSLKGFEERLKVNLIKKWNSFEKDKLDEDFQLYTLLEFMNEGPIAMEYKGVRILGDKLRLQIADNERAQDLAYMALGTGILEMNSRGAGFVNYRWL